jgi:hypothetical protein
MCRLTWLYIYDKADNFRFQQADLTLYLWKRLVTVGFSKPAWLYTYGKG